jgi:hypothetical protein
MALKHKEFEGERKDAQLWSSRIENLQQEEMFHPHSLDRFPHRNWGTLTEISTK